MQHLLAVLLYGCLIVQSVFSFSPKEKLHRSRYLSLSAVPVQEQTAATWTESTITLSQKATPDLWKFLVPKMWESSRGFDSTRRWTSRDSTDQVAREWIQDAFPFEDQLHADKLQAELAAFLKLFTAAVQRQGNAQAFKARVVASRGSAATKCPQWHLDHVPVRHIQSLVGPGCEFVGAQYVRWENINALSDDDGASVVERNQLLVDPEAIIDCASEGQAVLLVGNEWSCYAGYEVTPCVHRSPHGLKPWEGRVLLTIDIDDGNKQ